MGWNAVLCAGRESHAAPRDGNLGAFPGDSASIVRPHETGKCHFSYKEAFPNAAIADAYERLILDAIRGDASLFARGDEVEAAWNLLTPVLEVWKDRPGDVQPYFTGTWGPDRAATILGEGRTWREP